VRHTSCIHFVFHNLSTAAQSHPRQTPQEPAAPEEPTASLDPAAPIKPLVPKLKILGPKPRLQPADDNNNAMEIDGPELAKVSMSVYSFPFIFNCIGSPLRDARSERLPMQLPLPNLQSVPLRSPNQRPRLRREKTQILTKHLGPRPITYSSRYALSIKSMDG
jgi:hypothetical protein